MIKKAILIGFMITLPINALSFYSEYMNNQSNPLVQENMGIGTKFNALTLPLTIGIEYIKINTYGTIHKQKEKKAISKQTHLAIPIGLYYQFTPLPKLRISAILGIKVYTKTQLSNDQTSTIEQEKTITGAPVLSNYSEHLNNHEFYKIELSYQFWKQWNISFAKSWNKLNSTTTFTYLESYPVEKKNVFNYDPISIAIAYHF